MWLIDAMILLSGSLVTEAPKPCDIRIGELVPNATVAREIAEAIIRGRQTPERMSEYVLHVGIDKQDAGKWIVGQGIPPTPPSAEGSIVVTAGGGGITMRLRETVLCTFFACFIPGDEPSGFTSWSAITMISSKSAKQRG